MRQIDISTKKFPCTFTLVDDKDYYELSGYKWHAIEGNSCLYAERSLGLDNESTHIRMHRVILGLKKGEIGDHRDGDGLNNQRYNLRRCTGVQNSQNRRVNKNTTSGYKGVTWYIPNERWIARIHWDNKRHYLGSFTCLVKAAKAYDAAAIEMFGEFARLNFPDEHLGFPSLGNPTQEDIDNIVNCINK